MMTEGIILYMLLTTPTDNKQIKMLLMDEKVSTNNKLMMMDLRYRFLIAVVQTGVATLINDDKKGQLKLMVFFLNYSV